VNYRNFQTAEVENTPRFPNNYAVRKITVLKSYLELVASKPIPPQASLLEGFTYLYVDDQLSEQQVFDILGPRFLVAVVSLHGSFDVLCQRFRRA
jgi:hypothetical protein